MDLRSVGVWGNGLSIAALTGWAVWTGTTADHRLAGAGIGLVTASALWARCRVPVITLMVTFAGLISAAGVAGFGGPDDPFIVIIAWAAFSVGRHARLAAQPWAAAAALFLLSLNVVNDEPGALPAKLVFPVLFTAVPWLLGLALRLAEERAQTATIYAEHVVEGKDEEVRRAAVNERMRLARELHDVAAHHMSAVSLQVQVLRRRAEAGERLTGHEVLIVELAARQAMEELRRVTGVLRSPLDGTRLEPEPGLDDVPELVSDCNQAGHRVELLTTGLGRPLAAGESLNAYRIVQEALSNARRHGADGTAVAEIQWLDESLHLRVTNKHRPGSPPDSLDGSTGNGLAGMRERVAMCCGSIEVGPDGLGRWVVDVHLPAVP